MTAVLPTRQPMLSFETQNKPFFPPKEIDILTPTSYKFLSENQQLANERLVELIEENKLLKVQISRQKEEIDKL